MAKKQAETPLMKQHAEMKRLHPDAILLFRVGDFYETFAQDAVDTASILGITLTRRANGTAASVPLAGFPHHAIDTYLPKLVRAGRRVAICEQLEDPKLAKKLVKRGITELVTPGVNYSEAVMNSRENNFLGGWWRQGDRAGVAFVDISTGEFLCAEGTTAYADKLISDMAPREMLRVRGSRDDYERHVSHRPAVFELEEWVYTLQGATERLVRHFGTAGLKGFGVDDMPLAVTAAGSLLHYLDITGHRQLGHITALRRIEEERHVRLDRFTLRNLELLAPMAPGGTALADILDRTLTPMGARLLRRRLTFPLLDTAEIDRRLDAAGRLLADAALREAVAAALQPMGDLERLVSRAATRRAGPRDMLQLAESLRSGESLRTALAASGCPPLEALAEPVPDLSALTSRITATLRPDAPALLSKGGVIARGVDAGLDSLADLVAHSKDALRQVLDQESERTGIPGLKVSFNNVFGYYIEVRNTHRNKVPADWIRRQTLVNAERYITPLLKEYEQKILGAEERIAAAEARIFAALVDTAAEAVAGMQAAAAAAAAADCLLSTAETARLYGYTRPVVDDSEELDIEGGRHPVIERQLPAGEPYIANSVRLDTTRQQILMITGPNMSGKSALLRQTALIAVMAQAGMYVPADRARIGLVDKVFTRVGASDNISSGESTFMVEMTEAASILNNISQRSLILFDELGRGTSTYDGISIAWSIVEYLHENGRCAPRTLFATHYHELNEMAAAFGRIANYNVSVREIDGQVVFVRKLEPGGSAHSFGIHVARLAGMPPSIVRRAGQVLARLEESASRPEGAGEPDAAYGADSRGMPGARQADVAAIGRSREGCQLSIFQLDDPLLSQIRDRLLTLDIDNLTPLQALTHLHELQSLLKG